jgi:hypothetical protein
LALPASVCLVSRRRSTIPVKVVRNTSS